MTPDKTVLRRMHILRRVGMAVVIAVVRRPPQRPSLRGGRADYRENKLYKAACAKRLMGKIPVIKTRNGKHPQEIHGQGEEQGEDTPTRPNNAQAGDMQADERDDPDPTYGLGLISSGLWRRGRVKPPA